MFIFAKTSLFVLHNFPIRQKYLYLSLIIPILFIFTISDSPKFDNNTCERNAILQIANSKKTIVAIEDNCTVLSWTIIENPQESKLNTKLLKIWSIIDEDKLYYHTSPIANKQDE